MMKKLLLIEDDIDLVTFLKEILKENDYFIKTASKGSAGLNILTKYQPDLVILDLGLPDMSGESVCLEIRKVYPQLPIIFLTARDSDIDIVRGLNLGADDYIAKPFDNDVLLARIKARLRQNEADEIVTVADLKINNKTLEVKRGTKSIKLSPQEYKLLEYLMLNKGRVLSRDMILNHLWLSNPDIETRIVDVYMGYLRKKIDTDFKKKLLFSVKGFGYTIKD